MQGVWAPYLPKEGAVVREEADLLLLQLQSSSSGMGAFLGWGIGWGLGHFVPVFSHVGTLMGWVCVEDSGASFEQCGGWTWGHPQKAGVCLSSLGLAGFL